MGFKHRYIYINIVADRLVGFLLIQPTVTPFFSAPLPEATLFLVNLTVLLNAGFVCRGRPDLL